MTGVTFGVSQLVALKLTRENMTLTAERDRYRAQCDSLKVDLACAKSQRDELSRQLDEARILARCA